MWKNVNNCAKRPRILCSKASKRIYIYCWTRMDVHSNVLITVSGNLGRHKWLNCGVHACWGRTLEKQLMQAHRPRHPKPEKNQPIFMHIEQMGFVVYSYGFYSFLTCLTMHMFSCNTRMWGQKLTHAAEAVREIICDANKYIHKLPILWILRRRGEKWGFLEG